MFFMYVVICIDIIIVTYHAKKKCPANRANWKQ